MGKPVAFSSGDWRLQNVKDKTAHAAAAIISNEAKFEDVYSYNADKRPPSWFFARHNSSVEYDTVMGNAVIPR